MTRTGEHGESCATVQSIPLDLADAKADNSQFAVLVSASSASKLTHQFWMLTAEGDAGR